MGGESESEQQAAHRWVGFVGLFIAPTTLITGLCYFFGSVYTGQRLKYFAVDPQTLGFTTADYVVMNVKVFFFPVTRLLLVCAVLVWAAVAVHRLAISDRRTREIRIAGRAAMIAAIVPLGVATSWLLFEYPQLRSDILIALMIGAGTGLLVAGYWMLVITRDGEQRERARSFVNAERLSLGIAVAVIVAALFWWTDIYAADLGKRQGRYSAEHDLWRSDIGVVLVTNEALSLPAALADLAPMTTVSPDSPDVAVAYRYECLRKLEVRNNRWVLVPATWKPDKGYAITVTPDATNRILTRPTNQQAIGDNPNVRSYWRCPEVVRIFGDADLDQVIVHADEVEQLLAVEELVSPPTSATRPSDPAPDDCAVAADPRSAATVRDRGFTAGRELQLSEGTAPTRTSVRQSVATFENPSKAIDFVIATKRTWEGCQDAVTTVQNGGVTEQRTLGRVGYTDDNNTLYVIDSAIAGDRERECSHVITAKSNVVVDVHVCGLDAAASAGTVAMTIRDKIPT